MTEYLLRASSTSGNRAPVRSDYTKLGLWLTHKKGEIICYDGVKYKIDSQGRKWVTFTTSSGRRYTPSLDSTYTYLDLSGKSSKCTGELSEEESNGDGKVPYFRRLVKKRIFKHE